MTQFPTPAPGAVGGTRLVVIALVLAIVAVVLNSFYIARVRRGVEADTFNAYVLTRSLLPGDRLKKTDVKEIALPRTFSPGFVELGAMDKMGLDSRMGEAIARAASSGDILRYLHFEPIAGRDIDRNIPTGMRAVPLPVNSRTISAYLREGMFVDIEAPFQTGGGLPVVLPVMENMKVIAIGSRTVFDETDSARNRPIGTYHSITIVVTPAEATYLSMIERLTIGDFDLHLRNPGDTKLVKIPLGGINPAVLALLDKKSLETPAAKK